MILDANLTFVRATDSPVTTTRAIPLGQSDLEGNSKGLGAYQNLMLNVTTGENIASLGVTLETSDTETGTYEPVVTYPTQTGLSAGKTVVCERLPWNVRNWIRLTFTVAAKVNAHLTVDADKKFPLV